MKWLEVHYYGQKSLALMATSGLVTVQHAKMYEYLEQLLKYYESYIILLKVWIKYTKNELEIEDVVLAYLFISFPVFKGFGTKENLKEKPKFK